MNSFFKVLISFLIVPFGACGMHASLALQAMRTKQAQAAGLPKRYKKLGKKTVIINTGLTPNLERLFGQRLAVENAQVAVNQGMVNNSLQQPLDEDLVVEVIPALGDVAKTNVEKNQVYDVNFIETIKSVDQVSQSTDLVVVEDGFTYYVWAKARLNQMAEFAQFAQNKIAAISTSSESSQENNTNSGSTGDSEDNTGSGSFFEKGRSFASSHKKSLGLAVAAIGAGLGKVAYDYMNNSKGSEQNSPIKISEIEKLVADKVANDLVKEIAPAIETPVENIVIVPGIVDTKNVTVLTKFSENMAQKIQELKAKMPEMPVLTIKEKVIAASVAIGLGAVAYKLLSMSAKPSFDDLVQQYIYETTETDPIIIIEQFCQALQDHGYTSEEYKQKAMDVFEAADLV